MTLTRIASMDQEAPWAVEVLDGLGCPVVLCVLRENDSVRVVAANRAAIALVPPAVRASVEPLLREVLVGLGTEIQDACRARLRDEPGASRPRARLGELNTDGAALALYAQRLSDGRLAVWGEQLNAGGQSGGLGMASAGLARAAPDDRFRRALENTSAVFALVNGSGEVIYVSPSVTNVLGYDPEDYLRRDPWSLIHPEERAKMAALFATTIARPGVLASQELRFQHRDGTYRDMEADYMNGLDDPALGALVVSMRDVTQRKRMEEALRQTQDQLRQSQKMDAVGRLAGGIAHDFNNLLSVVLGYTNMALEAIGNGHPIAPDLVEIRRAGERAASLTRQLLAFSRQQVLSTEIVNVNEVVSLMDNMLRRFIGEDIELQTITAPELWKVRVDPGQLEQVILNLAVNARDAMPHGGVLAIETANVRFAESSSSPLSAGAYVMLAVSDTGTGVDPETQGKIFEPFFTTKGPGKGTGLGLATVMGIVQQSGGHVSLESEVGKGSTFRVYLPQTIEVAHRLSSLPVPPPTLRGTETVLLVEDEAQLRVLARTILRKGGYEVLEAANAVEALAIVEQFTGRIDVLLTDVVLPGQNGREIADRVTAKRPHIRTLYMSGYTGKTVVNHGVLDSGIGFLQKPFAPDALLRKLRELLDGRDGSGE